MNDDLDVRLRTAFRSAPLPPATPTLVAALERLPLDAPAHRGQRVRLTRVAALAAAAIAAVSLVAIGVGLGLDPRGVGPLPSPTIEPSPSPTAPPPSAEPSPGATDVGHPLHIVATLLRERGAGRLGGEQFVVSAFWTDRRSGEACATQPSAVLLIGCEDGRFGLTDGGPVGEWRDGTFVAADTPVVTPYVSPTILASLPYGPRLAAVGVSDPPLPVVFLAHFDDPRADECGDRREECLDRLVVDELYWVEDPDAPPSPTPDADPTPFSFASPPPAPFSETRCLEARNPTPVAGDPQPVVGFGGWIPSEDLEVVLEPFAPLPEAVYVIVTENEIPLGSWIDDPAGSGERLRYWGRSVCYGWNDSGIFYGAVPGTLAQVFEDGRRVEVETFVLPSAPPPP